MNSVNITGRLVTEPDYCFRGFMHVTDFDIEVAVHKRRTDRFHVVTCNDLAPTARWLLVGATIAVNGSLRSEAHDMPDRSIWYKTEILAYELDQLG
jgi:hypothetical protein